MHIFAKYCTPSPVVAPAMHKRSGSASTLTSAMTAAAAVNAVTGPALLVPPQNAYLTPAALDQWARDTNGSVLPKEAKEELEQLGVTEEGNLT